MPVIVRRANLKDAPIIAGFALKLFAQHRDYDPRRFAQLADSKQAELYYGKQIKDSESAVLVAELDKQVIGFAFVQFEEMNYADLLESAARLHDIYVDEAYRGSKAGKLLLEAAVRAAKELKASKLMLAVAAQNDTAQKVFRRAGFQTTMHEMMLDLTEQKDND